MVGDSAGEELRVGEPDPGCSDVDAAVVVHAQSPAAGSPGVRTLDHPSLGEDGESSGWSVGLRER